MDTREGLEKISETDVSAEGFAFGSGRYAKVAGVQVWLQRLSYVGELGWELHLPVEYAQTVYDALMQSGKDHGLTNAGYRAIETLRLEKGYRAWGADIGPDHTQHEAGLGWAVKLAKNIDFKGRAAFEAQKSVGVKKILAGFTIAPGVVLFLDRDLARVRWRRGLLRRLTEGLERQLPAPLPRDGEQAAKPSSGPQEGGA